MVVDGHVRLWLNCIDPPTGETVALQHRRGQRQRLYNKEFTNYKTTTRCIRIHHVKCSEVSSISVDTGCMLTEEVQKVSVTNHVLLLLCPHYVSSSEWLAVSCYRKSDFVSLVAVVPTSQGRAEPWSGRSVLCHQSGSLFTLHSSIRRWFLPCARRPSPTAA